MIDGKTYIVCSYIPNFLFLKAGLAVDGAFVDDRTLASVPRLNVTDIKSIWRIPRSVTDLHVPSNFMQE